MTYERAELPVDPTKRDAFEAALVDALPILRAAAGCHSATVARGVEMVDTYLLLVEWDDVAAHEAFRRTEAFARFGGLLAPCFSGPTDVRHFEAVGL